jgi:hypothetical protein
MSGAGFHVHGAHDHELEHAAHEEQESAVWRVRPEREGAVLGGPAWFHI